MGTLLLFMKNTITQARREKAWHKKQADRDLICLSKERNNLWQMLRDAPLRKLEHPYQRGWVRYFVLTEEAARRKDAARFQALLSYIQCIQYCGNLHFMERPHWKSKRLRPRKHRLAILNAPLMIRLKIPDELLSYLVTQKRRPISSRARLIELMRSGYNGQIKVRHPHYFLRKVEPYMITHARIALPEVERRMAEVEYILDQPQNRGRLDKLQRSRSYAWKWCDVERERRQSKRTAVKDIESALLEYPMEPRSANQEGAFTPPSLLSFRVMIHTICRQQGTRYLIAPRSSNG